MVVGVLVGQLVRAAVGQGRAVSSDADERVACLFRRVKGRAAAVGGQVLDDLVGLMGSGSSAIHHSFGCDNNEVGLVVELDLLGIIGHFQNMGVRLTVSQAILVVHQIARCVDGHLLAHNGLDGVLIEQLARIGRITEVIVDRHIAGRLGRIQEVDLQRSRGIFNRVQLAEVVLQRPAVKALRHSLIGLAHAGIRRFDGVHAFDHILRIKVCFLQRILQSELFRVQRVLVHGNELDSAGALHIVKGVHIVAERRAGSDRTGSARLKFRADIVADLVRVCGEPIAVGAQVKGVASGVGVIGLIFLGIDHRDDLCRSVGQLLLQEEVAVAAHLILEGNLIVRLGAAQRHILDQLLAGFQSKAVQRRGGDFDFLSLAVAAQYLVGDGGAVLHQRITVFIQELNGDLCRVLLEVIDDDRVGIILHIRSIHAMAVDLVGGFAVGIAGDHALHRISGIRDHIAGALVHLLVVAVDFLRTKHKLDGVGHEVCLRHREVAEDHRVRVIQRTIRNGNKLHIGRIRTIQSRAAQCVALHGRGPNLQCVAFLQRVCFGIAGGRSHFRVGICCIGVILQHDSDRLGVRDGVLKLHLVVRAGRGDRLTCRCTGLQRVAGPRGSLNDRLRALDGGDRIALEHLAIANQIHSDLRVLVCAGILVPEGHSLTRLVLHEVGGRVAVCHGLVVAGDGYIREGVALADLQTGERLPIDLSAGSHILLDDDDILRLAGIFVSHNDVAHAAVGVICEVIHLRAAHQHALRRGGGLVVFDGRGCGLAGQIDIGAPGHSAAVLAVKLLAAICVHNHHSHIALVLGIVESNRVSCGGIAGLDGLARSICRVAGDRRGVDRSLYVLLQRSRVALEHFSVVHRLDGDIGHVALIVQHDLDGAALVNAGQAHIELAVRDFSDLILGVHHCAGQLQAGQGEHGDLLGGCAVGDGLSALKQSIAVGADALDMDGDHLLVDGLILKGDRLILGDVRKLLHCFRTGGHGIAVNAGRGDLQALAVHHLIGVLEVIDRKVRVVQLVLQHHIDGMHMGDILEHDLGDKRSRCAGGGDRLILIIVGRIGLVAIGRGGSLDELRLVLDTGHLIGADDLVAVGAVHQLDQNIGIIGGVLLIEELHILIFGLVVGDEEGLAGVALHLVARDLRGGDCDGLAGGDALVAGLVQIQDLAVFIIHIGVDRDVLGLGLILVGNGDVVGAVELRRITIGGSGAVCICIHQLIVVEGGRCRTGLVGSLPLHQRTAGESAQIVRDTCAVHIDRLVDQIARGLLILKGDGIIAVLRGRKVLGILVVLGLIADEVGGGDGGLLVQLILHHLIGVVRDGIAIGVRRLDGNIRHVPIVVEHDHLIALSEVDGVLGRCVGGVQLGGVLRERVVELVRFVLVVGLAAERTAGFRDLPLLPRPAVDRLLCETVLAVADRGILPQLRFRTVLSANAHNIDERSGGGNNITSRSNGNIAAHIAHDDLDLTIAVRVAAQMLLLDGHLGVSIAARFLGGIHRPAVAPVVFCPGLGQNIVADDLSFLICDG